MSSSVNNSSQANSEIEVAAAAPQVHFAEEARVEAGPSTNPDGDRRRRRHHRRTDQRATRRLQRATSTEVEFSNGFSVSSIPSIRRGTCLTDLFRKPEIVPTLIRRLSPYSLGVRLPGRTTRLRTCSKVILSRLRR